LTLICLAALASPLAEPVYSPHGRARVASADDQQPDRLEFFQGYLDPAPRGLDVRYAWTLPGGRGENVRIVDIEFNWNLDHNDLVGATSDLFIYVKGRNPLPDPLANQLNLDHGTAVLGELVAAPDGVGVTGIAHRARLGLVNPWTEGNSPNVAGAIRRAIDKMEAGDVMLLEQQSIAGPNFNIMNGRGLVPIEYEPPVFDAIKEATARGIIVVESAGNGFENLDDPIYKGAFDRGKRDSGALIVGAGLPEGGVFGPGPDRTRTEESNYGSRVDLQGWGRFVVTTGFGVLRKEQGENNWYTDLFGATSAATAMIAGAAALIQSIVKERGFAPLTPSEMRQLLVLTGTPQAGNTNENIGPRPDLRAAIEALDRKGDALAPVIRSAKMKSGKKLILDGENFLQGDSVIEINGEPVARLKYPSEFYLPNGLTTRLVTKSDVSGLIPPGEEVTITVFIPSSNKRSEPFTFRRE
jgi:subtilisin family serine protease